jgi:hypothetical protein
VSSSTSGATSTPISVNITSRTVRR